MNKIINGHTHSLEQGTSLRNLPLIKLRIVFSDICYPDDRELYHSNVRKRDPILQIVLVGYLGP